MKKYIIILVATFTFASCSESFFNNLPTDDMTMEGYMKATDEIRNVLYDAYFYTRDISMNLVYINDLGTDVAYNRKMNNSYDHTSINESDVTSILGVSSNLWINAYKLINRANMVIEKSEIITDATLKAQLVNEAKFLRAYAYFAMVRIFGPVPLTTVDIPNYKDLYAYGRTPVEEVYTQIINDLTDAKALPETYSAKELGHATSIAAKTMLADVYMTRKDFASAKTLLEEVIAKEGATLGLMNNIADVFDSQKANNKEVIFCAQFVSGQTPSASNYLMGASILNITTPATQPSYIYPDGTKATIATTTGGGQISMTNDLYDRYVATDKRKTDIAYNGLLDQQFGNTYLPTTLKYYDHQNNVQKRTSIDCGCDNIIYRYADVLLMYAECLNETNSGDAMALVNRVRARSAAAPLTVTGQSDIRLAIENERFLELCFEGHRWFDLLRTGRLQAVMSVHFKYTKVGLDPVILQHQIGDGNCKIDEHELLYPIPYDQHLLMPEKLYQNPGYGS